MTSPLFNCAKLLTELRNNLTRCLNDKIFMSLLQLLMRLLKMTKFNWLLHRLKIL